MQGCTSIRSTRIATVSIIAITLLAAVLAVFALQGSAAQASGGGVANCMPADVPLPAGRMTACSISGSPTNHWASIILEPNTYQVALSQADKMYNTSPFTLTVPGWKAQSIKYCLQWTAASADHDPTSSNFTLIADLRPTGTNCP